MSWYVHESKVMRVCECVCVCLSTHACARAKLPFKTSDLFPSSSFSGGNSFERMGRAVCFCSVYQITSVTKD